MEVLAAQLGTNVPRVFPERDEEREFRKTAIKLQREHIALLEAQEAVLRRMSGQG